MAVRSVRASRRRPPLRNRPRGPSSRSSCDEGSLRRKDVRPRNRDRLRESARGGLENRLGRVVAVLRAEDVDVEVELSAKRRRLPELLDEGERKVLRHEEHLAVEGRLEDEIGPAREV